MPRTRLYDFSMKLVFITNALLRQIKQGYLKRDLKKMDRQITKRENILAEIFDFCLTTCPSWQISSFAH